MRTIVLGIALASVLSTAAFAADAAPAAAKAKVKANTTTTTTTTTAPAAATGDTTVNGNVTTGNTVIKTDEDLSTQD